MTQIGNPSDTRSTRKYVEARARAMNSVEIWDEIWETEEENGWRAEKLKEVYQRIVELVPQGSLVVDIGGGVGDLANILAEEKECNVIVVDHSEVALKYAREQGHSTEHVDLEEKLPTIPQDAVVVGTEILEHLSEASRIRLLQHVSEREGQLAFFSIPNNYLGPAAEPQHAVKYTAVNFKTFLGEFFPVSRVEVMGREPEESFLLGVCGIKKSYKMSVTFPARDEAARIEHTLMSFRGIADEIVVGIDPRTEDNTAEIAGRYAEKVFYLEDPEGPPGGEMPEGGVHFAWIRNQCIQQCTGDWIFMTEAHEYLDKGTDALLNIYKCGIPRATSVCVVFRRTESQRWGFPWLFKNNDTIRFIRGTHNTLDFPKNALVVWIPQVETRHERDRDNAIQRSKQRNTQNRKSLMDDWLSNKNQNSLYYLGNEWRLIDGPRAIERYRQLLALPAKNGAQRYHARLALAKLLMERGEMTEARDVLLEATKEDWSRTEHWVWLGDIYFEAEEYTKALYFYRYAATTIGEPPFTLWWIELYYYSYIPAQRLAMTYSALNKLEEARHWAERVLELLPEDAPDAVVEECEDNLEKIKEAIADDEAGG